jgi:hypothetical protein
VQAGGLSVKKLRFIILAKSIYLCSCCVAIVKLRMRFNLGTYFAHCIFAKFSLHVVLEVGAITLTVKGAKFQKITMSIVLNGESRDGVISGDYLHSVRIRSFSST